MERVDLLVVGAGISGLAFANAALARGRSAVVLEREAEPGGYCRTVERDGFVWDYSGHFFHFRHPEIEAWLLARMPADGVVRVTKRSRARAVDGQEVEFPFQKNIHQLDREGFLACLRGLIEADRARDVDDTAERGGFRRMLERRYGRGVCERFLVPYNEKLYATDLDALDEDAMGRFFPHARLADVLDHIARSSSSASAGSSDGSYNATFTYPRLGAAQYVRALLADLPPGSVRLSHAVAAIDVDRKVVTTSTGQQLRFERLITSAPLPATLAACGVPHDATAFRGNQVLVHNLGFDAKGDVDIHWRYFASPALSFYRVGYYDNILDTDRMSLYVEIGLPSTTVVDDPFIARSRARVLEELRGQGVVQGQALVAHHDVVMRPAYAHITRRSMAEAARTRGLLAEHGVHSIGRYGAWTYCSIEDNIVEARALADAILGEP